MDGLTRGYSFLIQESQNAEGWRAEDEWRALHRRPDALPLPPKPPRRSLASRIVMLVPVLRRTVVDRS